MDRSGQLVRPDTQMAATHRREGVLMIGPPAAPLGKPATADLRDVAPTILEMLGAAPLRDAEGRVLCELFPVVGDHAIAQLPRVPTRITDAAKRHPPAQRHASDATTPPMPVDQRDVEKRLRELGYME